MSQKANLHYLPEDVLLEIAGYLTSLDLISFSFTCSKCYVLSIHSTAFWNHDEVILEFWLASARGAPNPYRAAALRLWRLRRSISSRGPMPIRMVKHVDLGNRPAVGSFIVPGTQFMISLTAEWQATTPGVKLLCVDLFEGSPMEIIGDFHRGTFYLDAKRVKGSICIAVVAYENPHHVPHGGDNYLAVYRAEFIYARPDTPRALRLHLLWEQQISRDQFGQVNKVLIEGAYIVVESYQLATWVKLLHTVKWMNPDSEQPDEPAIIQHILHAANAEAWTVCDGYLIWTKSREYNQIYIVSLDAHQVNPGSTFPCSCAFSQLEQWPTHRIVADRRRITRTRDILRIQICLIGSVRQHRSAYVREFELRLPIHLRDPALYRSENLDDQRDHSAIPSHSSMERLGIGPITNRPLLFSTEEFKAAALNDGILWTLQEHRDFAYERNSPSSFITRLSIRATESPYESFKVISNIPRGNYRLVDMDVGVVVGVGMSGTETHIEIHWYS